MKYTVRDMGRKGLASAKGFGKVGALFSASECVIESVFFNDGVVFKSGGLNLIFTMGFLRGVFRGVCCLQERDHGQWCMDVWGLQLFRYFFKSFLKKAAIDTYMKNSDW